MADDSESRKSSAPASRRPSAQSEAESEPGPIVNTIGIDPDLGSEPTYSGDESSPEAGPSPQPEQPQPFTTAEPSTAPEPSTAAEPAAPSSPKPPPRLIYASETDPTATLATVIQPGTTTTQPPPDLKPRLTASYNAIAERYNTWTQSHMTHRLEWATRLIHTLQADTLRRGRNPPVEDFIEAMRGTEIAPTVVSLKGMHALDVGCGSGVPVIEVLLAKDLEVIGVDVSAKQLEIAREHFPVQTEKMQVVWAERDMMELRYPPGEFDVVVGLYSLIHLPREEQTVFLHRVVRWLKPGGLVLMNFARDEMEGEVQERWLGWEKGWMYWSSWGEEKTVRLLEELGFEILAREVTLKEKDKDADFVWIIAQKDVNAVVKFVPEPSPEAEVEAEAEAEAGSRKGSASEAQGEGATGAGAGSRTGSVSEAQGEGATRASTGSGAGSGSSPEHEPERAASPASAAAPEGEPAAASASGRLDDRPESWATFRVSGLKEGGSKE